MPGCSSCMHPRIPPMPRALPRCRKSLNKPERGRLVCRSSSMRQPAKNNRVFLEWASHKLMYRLLFDCVIDVLWHDESINTKSTNETTQPNGEIENRLPAHLTFTARQPVTFSNWKWRFQLLLQQMDIFKYEIRTVETIWISNCSLWVYCFRLHHWIKQSHHCNHNFDANKINC
jgi:hypothetical protein